MRKTAICERNVDIVAKDKKYFLDVFDFVEEKLQERIVKNYDRTISVSEKGGRPLKHTPWEVAEKGLEYFRQSIKEETTISIGMLSIRLDVSRRQLLNWSEGRWDGKGKDNEEFRIVISLFKNLIVGYHEIMVAKARNPYYHIFVLTRMGFGRL